MQTKFDPLTQRKTARDFALKVYADTKLNRSYALTPESTTMLSALAAVKRSVRGGWSAFSWVHGLGLGRSLEIAMG
jgi:hypothetical protein